MVIIIVVIIVAIIVVIIVIILILVLIVIMKGEYWKAKGDAAGNWERRVIGMKTVAGN